jgi:hypothetical protein
VLRVVDTDVATRGIAPAVPPGCAAAVVLDLDGTPSGLGVRVQTADSCPLVVAMNYAETLEAWGPQRLRTFPAYGALLGIEVPAGTLRVEIQPRSWPPSWTHPFAAAGAGLLVLLLRPR